MLTARLNECLDCGSVEQLIRDIDCTLAVYGRNHLLNISFDTCNLHSKEKIKKLLHYKRILTKRLFNPGYACGVDLAPVFSRVKTLLLYSDCCKLAEACEFPTAETFEEVSS